jgi:hypothetical protein
MKKNILILISCLILLSGCGPKKVSDQEFTESAKPVCKTLYTDVKELPTFDLVTKADAYDKAAAALKEINITEISAPKSYVFLQALVEDAKRLRSAGTTLAAALKNANMDASSQIMVGEDGTVFAGPSIFKIQKIDVGTTMKDLMEADKTFYDAANSLGMEDCQISIFQKTSN